MKQNLRGQAFVVFCVFSGQNLITKRVRIREIAAKKKSSQHATNLAYSSPDKTDEEMIHQELSIAPAKTWRTRHA